MKHLTGMLATAGLALLTAVTPARAQEVKLGVVMANTGTYAFVGTAVINAVRLAFDEMQARNYFGSTKVVLLVEHQHVSQHGEDDPGGQCDRPGGQLSAQHHHSGGSHADGE